MTPIVNRRNKAAIRVVFILFPFLIIVDFSLAKPQRRGIVEALMTSALTDTPRQCA